MDCIWYGIWPSTLVQYLTIIPGISYLPQDRAYSWKVANSLQFVPGVIFFCLTFLLPESPRWLAGKYPEDDGPMLDALSSIRNIPTAHPDIIEEAKEIRDYNTWYLIHGSVTPWNIFTQKSLFKRTFHAFIPYLATSFSGIGLLTVSYGHISNSKSDKDYWDSLLIYISRSMLPSYTRLSAYKRSTTLSCLTPVCKFSTPLQLLVQLMLSKSWAVVPALYGAL